MNDKKIKFMIPTSLSFFLFFLKGFSYELETKMCLNLESERLFGVIYRAIYYLLISILMMHKLLLDKSSIYEFYI